MIPFFTRKTEKRPRETESASRTAVRKELAAAHARALFRDTLERFPELEPAQARTLVEDVVAQFFYSVMDLGASETYHHAHPWGLAHHSLEVAAHAIRVARTRHFVGHAAPNPEEQEYRLPRLRYGCFLFALYHDLGKLVHILVQGPGREIYNPFVEPLGAFYDKHGRDRSSADWQQGRGLDAHVWHTAYLVGRIMPIPAAHYLGPRILAELIEQKSPAGREVQEIILEADHRSVEDDRRKVEARAAEHERCAAPATPAYAPQSFAGYLEKAFQEGLKQGLFTLNEVRADIILGRRYAAFRYPEAVLKLIALVKQCFGPFETAARVLEVDESGARFFLAKLKADGGIFVDPQTSLWKLKATLRRGDGSQVFEVILIPREKLGAAPLERFGGQIAFSRPADGSEVVVQDFEAPDPPAVTPRVEVVQAPVQKPVPATLGPQEGIDPNDLVRHLLEGILEGWIPTNVAQAQVYVSPKKTFVATPAVFLRMREKGLYPKFNPQDKSSAFLNSLARVDFVQKSKSNRVVYPILLCPESERPLKVIKFDTPGLFTSKEILDRVGFWKDWTRIIELPQGWKPGDAMVLEANDD